MAQNESSTNEPKTNQSVTNNWSFFTKQTFLHNGEEFEYIPISVSNPSLTPPILIPSPKNELATNFIERVARLLNFDIEDVDFFILKPQEVTPSTMLKELEELEKSVPFKSKCAIIAFDADDEMDTGTVIDVQKLKDDHSEEHNKKKKKRKRKQPKLQ